MPFLRPSLTALQQQAITDLTSANLPVSGQVLNKSVLAILSYAMAGLAYEHFSYLDSISRESVPFTATGEYLEAWAALKSVLRKPSASASGRVTFTGSNGAVVPATTVVQRADGQQYSLIADVTIASGTGTGTVIAVTQGAATDDLLGISLTLVNTISGINATASTASALTGGADVETDDAFRSRMLQVFANPPQGGASSDYVDWALAVPGVTRAWCNPRGMGAGTVVVYPMFDVSEAAFSGFPQGSNGVATLETRDTAAIGDQLLVANYIYPLRPVTALVYVTAPIAQAINITINGLTPSTTVTRAAISTALTNLFLRIGTPLGMTVYESDLTSAIASVVGVREFVLTVPATTTAISVGSLPTLGVLTFT